MRVIEALQRSTIAKLLLVAVTVFPLGAATGIAVDRLNLVTSLVNRFDPAPKSRAGLEANLTRELLDFAESQYLTRRKAYQANYQFDQSATKDQLIAISQTARLDYLRSLLPRTHQSAINNLQTVELEPGANYRLQHITFSNANGLTVRGVLSVPTGERASYPVMIIPTGTNATGYDLFSIPTRDYHNDVGRRFAGSYIVFGLDLPGLNDDVFHMANAAGQNENYYFTCDKISSALDFVLRSPFSDESRVGIYGLSLGGYAAISGAICDERIDAIAASGTNVFDSKSTQLLQTRRLEQAFLYQHNIAQLPDLYQVLYGVFPKPVIMEMDVHDTTGEYTEAFSNSQKVMDYYKLRGKPDRAFRVIINDDTCRSAWKHHCMEVTRVKQAFDSLFMKPVDGSPARGASD
jgi:hypothetical protein